MICRSYLKKNYELNKDNCSLSPCTINNDIAISRQSEYTLKNDDELNKRYLFFK